MRLAQQLYEGIDIEGQGTVGLITYLPYGLHPCVRGEQPDGSRVISQEHMEKSTCSRGETKQEYRYKIQDAHEAIRPTDIAPDTGYA